MDSKPKKPLTPKEVKRLVDEIRYFGGKKRENPHRWKRRHMRITPWS